LDQIVHRPLDVAPCADPAHALHPLSGASLPTDGLGDTRKLEGDLLVGGGQIVERIGDLAGEAGPAAGQPHREIPVAHRLERAEQNGMIDLVRFGEIEWPGSAYVAFHQNSSSELSVEVRSWDARRARP